tara:strand:+ start:17 stop:529 length:513 start_codon:yes stop_codon:yes gene_type:complete
MSKLRKYIRKQIQSLHEQKSYPVPLELMDLMKDELKMSPLKRYVNNIKAVNSIPPSYKVFLHNGQDFDIIYLGDQENNFKVRIADKEYDLLVMDDKNYAIDALNRLLTAPLPPNFGGDDDEEESGGDFGDSSGGGSTTGMGGGLPSGDDDTAMEPDEDEPAETEPESDMI